MNHNKLIEKLSAYYDQRLSQPERWEMETHLQDCPSCRKTLREWKKTSSFLFSKPLFSEWNEDIFTQKVMAHLEPAPSFSWKALLPWTAPVVGSALVAVWMWSAILPNIPGLDSDSVLLSDNASTLSSNVSLSSETRSPQNPAITLISYDEDQ
jgi:anti-sigma factor RsiW